LNDPLVHPRERTLGTITLVLGLIGWLVVVVGTVGIALVYLLLGFLFYLFAHSALISWLRGNGVLLSAQQLPDLRDRFDACCATLGLDRDKPEAYLLQGGGVLNAFATRFLGRNYVVLLSDIVDAMKAHPDGINFYIGHELGHVRMNHLTGKLWRAPVLWLPLLGAAYSRAKESTCDRHGRACCESPESAARAMLALAAGADRWRQVDLPAFEAQASLTRGFWMSRGPVTVRAYRYFALKRALPMPKPPNNNPNWANDDHPIVNVTWMQAREYCAWVGGRLPTEAQWEYAGRGGSESIYPWGNDRQPDMANYVDNPRWGRKSTSPVGSFPENGFGLVDMVGNVWEWVSDWFDDEAYIRRPINEPTIDPEMFVNKMDRRVVRGGSWNGSDASWVRPSFRFHAAPTSRGYAFGFRCAKSR